MHILRLNIVSFYFSRQENEWTPNGAIERLSCSTGMNIVLAYSNDKWRSGWVSKDNINIIILLKFLPLFKKILEGRSAKTSFWNW